MYDIKITYQTGNSEGSYTTTDLLELPVCELRIAKENLQRIKQHYQIYLQREEYYRSPPVINYPEFVSPDEGLSLTFKIDDTKTHTISYAFWTGYFERLISAKIVGVGDDEVEFEV